MGSLGSCPSQWKLWAYGTPQEVVWGTPPPKLAKTPRVAPLCRPPHAMSCRAEGGAAPVCAAERALGAQDGCVAGRAPLGSGTCWLLYRRCHWKIPVDLPISPASNQPGPFMTQDLGKGVVLPGGQTSLAGSAECGALHLSCDTPRTA